MFREGLEGTKSTPSTQALYYEEYELRTHMVSLLLSRKNVIIHSTYNTCTKKLYIHVQLQWNLDHNFVGI